MSQILRTYRERGGEPRRGANGQRGRRGTHHRRNKLVCIVSAYAQAAASGFQSYELGGADARRRDVAGPLTAPARGQFRNFRPWIVSREAGSIIAFTGYVWLIHHEFPTKVGIYAYVNPVVVGPLSILGTLFVLISVVVITPTRVKKPVRALAVEDTGLTPR